MLGYFNTNRFIWFTQLLASSLLLACSPTKTNHQLVPAKNDEYVILLHGLARSPASMQPLARALNTAGYGTCVTGYPSRQQTVPQLSQSSLKPAVQLCQNAGAKKIHIVGHSMGAMIARYHMAHTTSADIGKLIQLAPPNQGSEVVNFLQSWPIFHLINGPAARTLGTDQNSLAAQLRPVKHSTLVIAGRCSVNPINSLIIPGANDGKVSVKNTRTKGTQQHTVIKASHPMIMKNQLTIQKTLRFLSDK